VAGGQATEQGLTVGLDDGGGAREIRCRWRW